MPEPKTADVLELEDGPKPKVTAEESLNAGDKLGEEVDPQATANEADDEIEEKVGKRLGGWQRKIKRLESEIEELRKGGVTAKPAQEEIPTEDKPPVKPVRPKETDFDDWGKFREAEGKYFDEFEKYLEEKDAYRARQREVAQEKKSEKQAVAAGWAAQVAEAKKELPDFEEVAFSKDIPMTNAMMEAIVDSELGAKIAYELGQNPDEAERIAKLSPVAAIREIGKIESRIAGKTKATEEKQEEEPAAVASRAPKPPVPVRKTTATNHEPTDSDDYKTWLRKREAQLRSK